MPYRFQLFERIVFSLVVLSAATCSAFVVYERCPEIRLGLQAAEAVLSQSGAFLFQCAPAMDGACAQ